MTIAFSLPHPMPHARFRKAEHLAPGWCGHYLRITSPEALDDELRRWLRESYHLLGEQRRFDTEPSQSVRRGAD